METILAAYWETSSRATITEEAKRNIRDVSNTEQQEDSDAYTVLRHPGGQRDRRDRNDDLVPARTVQ
jgi:hypothetical protein